MKIEIKHRDTNLKKEKPEYSEARRDYQRRYYHAHKEKAKAYQKAYNRKKRNVVRSTRKKEVREVVKSCFTRSDLINLPTVKFESVVNKITAGSRFLTV